MTLFNKLVCKHTMHYTMLKYEEASVEDCGPASLHSSICKFQLDLFTGIVVN